MGSVMKMISNIDQAEELEVRAYGQFASRALHEAKKSFRNVEMPRTRVSTVAYERREDVLQIVNWMTGGKFSVRVYGFSQCCGPGRPSSRGGAEILG